MIQKKLGVISLGCSKNRVDTEYMLGALDGLVAFTNNPKQADIILINTCGFINDAKTESIETILEMAQLGKKLIVAGCLAQRYQQELEKELPEVDAFVGVCGQAHIAEAVKKVLQNERYSNYEMCNIDIDKRMLTTPAHYAYVKIAEGCNNRCSYCAIPLIRGGIKSLPIEQILEQIKTLTQRGVKEIILVAQDTTKYGVDIYGKGSLPELLDRAAKIQGVKWLRVLYCYPENITEALIDVMLRHENIVKYIDMPVQHFDDAILRAMNRKNSRASVYETVRMIRSKSPEFTLRSTLISGFPQESEQAHKSNLAAIKELQFDKLGVFAYSPEEDTPAAQFSGQIDEDTKHARANEIMQLQAQISAQKLQGYINKTVCVIIEGRDEFYYGRCGAFAPEIDGKVFVSSKEELKIGEFYNVKITRGAQYDLYGEII